MRHIAPDAWHYDDDAVSQSMTQGGMSTQTATDLPASAQPVFPCFDPAAFPAQSHSAPPRPEKCCLAPWAVHACCRPCRPPSCLLLRCLMALLPCLPALVPRGCAGASQSASPPSINAAAAGGGRSAAGTEFRGRASYSACCLCISC